MRMRFLMNNTKKTSVDTDNKDTPYELNHIKNRPIVIDLSATHVILSHIPKKEREAALALYLFYYHHGIIQNNTRIKCTNYFVKGEKNKGLGWSSRKTYRIRKLLMDIGLIKIYRPHNRDGNFGKGSYIDLVYCKGREAVEIAKYRELIENQDKIIQGQTEKIEELSTLIFELKKQLCQNSTSAKKAPVLKSATINAKELRKLINAKELTQKKKTPGTCKAGHQRSVIPGNGKPLLPNSNIPKKKTFSDRMSKKLYKKVKSKNQLPFNSKSRSRWTATFTSMLKEDGRNKKRIRTVLEWYIEHYGEDFIPEARCANTFRKKFCEIEAAMKRSSVAGSNGNGKSTRSVIVNYAEERIMD